MAHIRKHKDGTYTLTNLTRRDLSALTCGLANYAASNMRARSEAQRQIDIQVHDEIGDTVESLYETVRAGEKL